MTFADTVFSWLPKWRKPDGSLADGQCDADGSLRVSVVDRRGAPGTWVEPERGTPLTHLRVVTASPRRTLRRLFVVNAGSAARYVMLFDGATHPIVGAQPVFLWPVAAGSAVVVEIPRTFESGLVWAASSTAGTYTPDPGALFWVNAELESA